MKLIITTLFFMLSYIILYGQANLRTDTKIEKNFNLICSNKFESYPNGYVNIFMKKSIASKYRERLSYWRTNIFKTDSLVGINFGYYFDLMPDPFKRSKYNTFRYWNRLRMGFFFGLTNNANGPFNSINIWNLLDGEITIDYLHIHHFLRGDQSLSKRRGYIKVHFSIKSSFDIDSYIAYKPIGYLWVKALYSNHYYGNTMVNSAIGIELEVLINPRGYKDCHTSLTKDYYKGVSFIVSSSYDLISNYQLINFGIRLQTRNH